VHCAIYKFVTIEFLWYIKAQGMLKSLSYLSPWRGNMPDELAITDFPPLGSDEFNAHFIGEE